ncbi:unnamed protein product, partial [Ectocarpus sp. 12 AP-2014]
TVPPFIFLTVLTKHQVVQHNLPHFLCCGGVGPCLPCRGADYALAGTMPPVPGPLPASGGLQPEASFDDGCAPNPNHVEINAIPPPDNGTATEVGGPAPAAAWRSKESSGDGGGGGGGGRGSSAWGVYCDGPLLEAVQSA